MQNPPQNMPWEALGALHSQQWRLRMFSTLISRGVRSSPARDAVARQAVAQIPCCFFLPFPTSHQLHAPLSL